MPLARFDGPLGGGQHLVVELPAQAGAARPGCCRPSREGAGFGQSSSAFSPRAKSPISTAGWRARSRSGGRSDRAPRAPRAARAPRCFDARGPSARPVTRRRASSAGIAYELGGERGPSSSLSSLSSASSSATVQAVAARCSAGCAWQSASGAIASVGFSSLEASAAAAIRTSRAGAYGAVPFVQSDTSGDAESGSSAVPRLASLAAWSSSRRHARDPPWPPRAAPRPRAATDRWSSRAPGSAPLGQHQRGAGISGLGGAGPNTRCTPPGSPSTVTSAEARTSAITGAGMARRSALFRIIVLIIRRSTGAFSLSMSAANAGVIDRLQAGEGRRIGAPGHAEEGREEIRAAPAGVRSSSFSSSRRRVVRKQSASCRIASALACRCAASSSSADAGW